MTGAKIWLCILGSALLTFLLRYLPLELLAHRQLPRPAIVWLRFVPSGVVAAICMEWMCVAKDGVALSGDQKLFLAVSLPSFLVAYFSRNFLATVLCGCGLTALARFTLGASSHL